MGVLFDPRRRRWVRFVTSVVLAAVTVMTVFPGLALADTWSDISDAEWQSVYRISAAQAWQVAEGYPDGTFRPTLPVTRGQFAKMVVDGLDIPKADPPVRRFSDVPRDHIFYQYVEGAVAAGIINGYTDGTYRPDSPIERQQCNSILGIYLANLEKQCFGYIQGTLRQYNSLQEWFIWEGAFWLGGFQDAVSVDPVHQSGTAYLVYRGIILGSESGGKYYLSPRSNLARAQAVAMIVRVDAKAADFCKPVVTSVAPNSGPLAGGNEVEIRGHGFLGVTQVSFGTRVAVYTVESGTKITATAPAGLALGTVPVRVTTAKGGTSTDSTADDYTYAVAPSIVSLNPSAGPLAGGNSVTISGSGFTGVQWVKFGDVTLAPTAYTVDSTSQISVTVPARGTPGTVRVSVSTPGGVTPETGGAHYIYAAAPTITGLDPTVGSTAGGNQVIVHGTSFVAPLTVKFGDSTATAVAIDSSVQVRATAPAHAPGTVNVSVTAAGGTSANTPADDYAYRVGPSITSLTPNAGPLAGGNQVRIAGANFADVQVVRFGDATATAVTVDSSVQITATAPAKAAPGIVRVSVVTPAGTTPDTAADDYIYAAAPTITGLDPTVGPTAGGNQVIVHGTSFVAPLTVKFGDSTATAVAIDSSVQVRATAPAHVPGTVNVSVTAAGGTSANTPADDYAYQLPPSVSSVVPGNGPTQGGTDVTIMGANFIAPVVVKFGDATATSVQIDSTTQVRATTPAHGAGVVDVDVITSGGTGTKVAGFEYLGTPVLSALSVYAGPESGGNTVTLTGSAFVNVLFVSFGDRTTTPLGGYTPTSLQVVVPAPVAAGDVTVTVTSTGGTSNGLVYRYATLPTVVSVDPTVGPLLGTDVTVTGTQFYGVTQVTFGGLPATGIQVVSPTVLRATAPPHLAGKVDVTVSAAGGLGTGLLLFEYVGAPTISSVDPTTGPTGASVTITGTNFVGSAPIPVSVLFGGTAAGSVIVDSREKLTVTVPDLGDEELDATVTVTAAGGSVSWVNLFRYNPPAT